MTDSSDGSLRSDVREWVTRRVALDTRTLAAFRVVLGCLLLADLFLRARNLEAFYTDRGVLPVAALADAFPAYEAISLNAISGSVAVQVGLFVLAGLAAIALIVGYRTRTMTLVSLVLLVSLQARNPMVLNAGDPLLRRLLFWSLFLPLGARWSVDARQGGSTPSTVASVASAGLLLQVVLVYVVTLGFKLQSPAWLEGRAVEQVLSLDTYAVLLGDVIAEMPTLLTAFNWVWVVALAASPLLIMLTDRRRLALVAVFIAMHLGMLLTLRLGLFPVISMAALVPFCGAVISRIDLPPAVDRGLDTLASVLPGGPSVPVPQRIAAARRRVVPALLAVVLAILLVVNAMALGLVATPAGTPDAVTDRSWDLFAPNPPSTDTAYLAPATLESGRTVDALAGGVRRADRPPDVAPERATGRWVKYFGALRTADPAIRSAFASHLCQRWNRTHDDGMVRVSLVAVDEPGPGGGSDGVRRVLGEYDCSSVVDA